MNIFTENPNFYPTPVNVIEQMMMNEVIVGKTVLEPSAGKGDIVDWLKANGAGSVIACEIDTNIRRLLDGKCEILAEDFMTVTSEQVSHVDYIVMNPPFSEGAQHILHAFEIAPSGCTIVALCNNSNLERGWKYETNKKLIETVELFGHQENLGKVFSSAERKTDVSVALIKLYKQGEGSNEFDGYFFSKDDNDAEEMNQKEGIMQYNVVREIVGRYVSAVKLFDETLAAANRINEMARYPGAGEYDYIPIKFGTMKGGYDGHEKTITHQEYKKELQKYYWRIIFRQLNMEKYATIQLREQINRFVEQQTNVPFTMKNIYRVIDMVIQTTSQRMDTALLEAFDHICSFSSENNTAGEKWKTNRDYIINRKFIVPYICEGYYSYDHRPHERVYFNWTGGIDRLRDVCKALCYLTGQNYDNIADLRDFHERVDWGKWFRWGFFRCKAFKKGTMHFEFLDEEVWMKFNAKVASLRGWRLPRKTK